MPPDAEEPPTGGGHFQDTDGQSEYSDPTRHRLALVAAGRPPHWAPIDGGSPCVACGWRTFRRLPLGVWRHEDCDPPAYRAMLANRRRRREPRRRSTAQPVTGCRGCCVCKAG